MQPWLGKLFGRRESALGAWVVWCWLALAVAPARGWQEDDPWTSDMNQAIRTAQQEQKDLLVLFTGSDWCPPCKKLEGETLSKADFLAGASREWVLVKLDFPRSKELPEELQKQNDDWSGRLGIAGFPTIALLDNQQRPFGFVGYLEGGPVAMLEALRDLKERRQRRDDALAAAGKLEGEDKAKKLDEALSALSLEVAEVWYEDLIAQIVELDPEDRLGLRTKWNSEKDAEVRRLMMADIEAIARLGKPEQAVGFIDEVLAGFAFPPAEKFEVLRIKLGLMQQAGMTEQAVALLDEMLAMPEITEQTRERLVVKKAMQLFSRGDKAGAIGLLDAVLQKNDKLFQVQLSKAQLLNSMGEREAAVEGLKSAVAVAEGAPDALIELVATLADLQCSAGDEAAGLETLEQFASRENLPVDLRAEALLQAAMIMREAGRTRPAMLTENRAVALAKSPELARELQRVVDALRSNAEPPAGGEKGPGTGGSSGTGSGN